MPKYSETSPSGVGSALAVGGARAEGHLRRVFADSRVPRALILGPGGSGKMVLLHRLGVHLTSEGREIVHLRSDTQIPEVPPSATLVVHDLLELGAEHLEQVLERSCHPESSLLVATRAWVHEGGHLEAIRSLAQRLPVVGLGYVTQEEIEGYLGAAGDRAAQECAAHLMEITGGIAWMVTAALGVHGRSACEDPNHADEQDLLADRTLHSLSMVGNDLRAAIERACIIGHDALAADPRMADEIVGRGVSEGLLLRDGAIPQIVRRAVLTTTPSHRLLEVASWRNAYAVGGAPEPGAAEDADSRVHIAHMLTAEARRILGTDPQAARQMLDRALDAGMDPSAILEERALAAWGCGDLDGAAEVVDAAVRDGWEITESLLSLCAAGWSARCMMSVASDTYLTAERLSPDGTVLANIAHLGEGLGGRARWEARPADPTPTTVPTTLSVALELLDGAMRSLLEPEAGGAPLRELVRASDLYSSSGARGPIVELPAVMAAFTALGAGDPGTAAAVLNDAVARGHGGAWARRRLLLWQAWVHLQLGQPAKVQVLITAAAGEPGPATPRDRILAATVRLSFARRYEDAGRLTDLWAGIRPFLDRAHFDTYLGCHLAELIMIGARMNEDDALLAEHSQSLRLLHDMGSPAPWVAHLHWAGIQRGLLLDRPELVPPHAQALVKLSQHNPLAAALAEAGRVWSSIRGGRFDPDAVGAVAKRLAGFGMVWEGARLAGGAASQSEDRAVKARLLAIARDLHPPYTAPLAPEGRGGEGAPASHTAERLPSSPLSEREAEIAHHVLAGMTYAEIGTRLFISPRTVEHHMARMRERIGASSRSELLSRLRGILGSF